MLTIEMLEADHGDCLWIEYGGTKRRRILIDGGTPATYARLKKRIEELPEDDRHFELFVVSHIDSDHIGGAVKLLNRPPEGMTFGDVWFNGYRHLPKEEDELGARQGEELTKSLVDGELPWNAAFGGEAIVCGVPAVELEGGLKLTVLSPGKLQLQKLFPVWDALMQKLRAEASEMELEEAVPEDELGEELDVEALAASRFKQDKAEPNGSSIALLLEYKGKRVLLGADAHPGVLEASIDEMLSANEESRLELDAFKVSHHGSRANTSRSLIEKLKCPRYLISTSGAQFRHPDREGIARILKFGGRQKELWFNYDSEFTRIWRDDDLEGEFGYKARMERMVEL